MAGLKRLAGLRPVPADWYYRGVLTARSGAAGHLQLRYLGTAGFVLSDARRTVVLDPYLSRPGAMRSLAARLIPDTALIRRVIPHADEVLIGHAHHDHILDAPDLCLQTGARLIGSRSTMMVGHAAGLPDRQLRETAGNEDIACGDWSVHGLPSRHGRLMGRIPFPGDITAPPPWPPRMRHLRHGLVLNWIVRTGGLTVAHIDSADFINEQLDGHRCDVLCLCAIGRKARPHYVRDAVQRLRPRWVVPCHWDTMLTPLHAEPDQIPGVDLPGFMEEIRQAGAEPLLTPMLGDLYFPCQY
ncbi:MBL fold metallo-hydrolase [Alcanivorax hongdengensis]|uniref:MBL fold metallo-hydrolase n=1 Tax=Alcanivorax hongdengensis TaxID=519051 RepID=UPI000A03F91D|nr:MBL fold metallo-hydrolase [Alcanivorax hongdengensis]